MKDQADAGELEELRRGIAGWGEQPDAFLANVHVEVSG